MKVIRYTLEDEWLEIDNSSRGSALGKGTGDCKHDQVGSFLNGSGNKNKSGLGRGENLIEGTGSTRKSSTHGYAKFEGRYDGKM